MFQVNQSDVEGRLRLFRYGMVVLVIVAFLVSFASTYAAYSDFLGLPGAPTVGGLLVDALITTVIVAVIAVAAYFGYSFLLKKTVGSGDAQTASES